MVREQDKKGHTYGNGGHQIRQKCHAVDVIGPFTSPVFGYGVADEGADGAGDQRTADADPDGTLKGPPDGLVVQNALLPVHAVFGDVFIRHPPLGGEIAGVAGVEEGVVPGVGQEGLKGKGDDGEDAGKKGDNYQRQSDDVLARPAQIDLGDLAGFAGDGGVALPAGEGELV